MKARKIRKRNETEENKEGYFLVTSGNIKNGDYIYYLKNSERFAYEAGKWEKAYGWIGKGVYEFGREYHIWRPNENK